MPGLRFRVAVAVLAAVLLGGVSTASVIWSGSSRAPATAQTLTLDGGLLVIRDRHLATAPLAAPGPVRVSGVTCVRSYAAAGTVGCLHQDTPWTYSLWVLDAALHRTRSFAVPGLPNRLQVSPSGRMVSWTSFISGDSYAGGTFSTRTGILDTATGERVDSLETFAVRRAGRPYRRADVNFWGVTFARDDRHFYATMSTDGHRYLVAGDYAAHRLETRAENVECPSLSPDGTRLAFKQAVGGDPARGWRLSVLDLATGRVTHLAETRSVDDQAAWLTGERVAYTVRDDEGNPSIWSVPADGSTGADRLLTAAESPSSLNEPVRSR